MFKFAFVDGDLNVVLAGVMPGESVANVTRSRRGIQKEALVKYQPDSIRTTAL